MAFHDIAPHTPEWHAIRARHVGASEVSALLDQQPPYAATRYALHHVKAGAAEPPPVDNERVSMGLALEPVIGAMAAARHGWTIRPGRYATDDACPGLGASLDFEVAAPSSGMPPEFADVSGPGCLETKNVDWMVHRKSWSGDEPPIHQLLQLQAQLACSGYEWGCLAALIGGNQLLTRFYRPRPRIIASIRQSVRDFWNAVHEGREPPADGSDATGQVIKALFPELAWQPADMRDDNTLPGLCADYLAASADAREADKRVKELRNQIMAKAGAHSSVMAQGFTIGISVTEAKQERPAPPGYVIPGRAESRRLTVKERTDERAGA